MRSTIVSAIVILTGAAALCQDVQVNRENKTIAVTADDSAEATPEIAILKIGYNNFGVSKESAYAENVKISRAIISTLLRAGIPETDIETAEIAVERTEPDNSWTAEMKKERQFKAAQSWTVRVGSANAQKVVDLAIDAGANYLEQPDWDVADPSRLQSLAAEAALRKARSVAGQMAEGLGTKLGQLIYASNRAPAPKWFRGTLQTMNASVASRKEPDGKPELRLFPGKVKAGATVYAVFAIE